MDSNNIIFCEIGQTEEAPCKSQHNGWWSKHNWPPKLRRKTAYLASIPERDGVRMWWSTRIVFGRAKAVFSRQMFGHVLLLICVVCSARSVAQEASQESKPRDTRSSSGYSGQVTYFHIPYVQKLSSLYILSPPDEILTVKVIGLCILNLQQECSASVCLAYLANV